MASLSLANRSSADLGSQLDQLKHDFTYNLHLLEGRDAELDAFEEKCAELNLLVEKQQESLRALGHRCDTLVAEKQQLVQVHADVQHAMQSRVEQLEEQLQAQLAYNQAVELQHHKQHADEGQLLQAALAKAEHQLRQHTHDVSAILAKVTTDGADSSSSRSNAEEAWRDAKAGITHQGSRLPGSHHSMMPAYGGAQGAHQSAAGGEQLPSSLQREVEKGLGFLGDCLAASLQGLLALQLHHEETLSKVQARCMSLEAMDAASHRTLERQRGQLQAQEQEHQRCLVHLQQQLDEANVHAQRLEAEVDKLQKELRTAAVRHAESLAAAQQTATAERQSAHASLTDIQRSHEKQVQNLQHQLTSMQQQGMLQTRQLREMSAELDRCNHENEVLQEQLQKASKQEAELQQQAAAARLRLEMQLEEKHAADSQRWQEELLQLQRQCATISSALEDALQRLAAKDALVTRLQHEVGHQSATGPEMHQQWAGRSHGFAVEHGREPAGEGAAGAGRASAEVPAMRPRHLAAKPSPLELSQSMQDLQDSLADLALLQSPRLAELPPTPGSNASYWLGPPGGPSPRTHHHSQSQDQWPHQQLHRPQSPQQHTVHSPRATIEELQAALEESRAQNQRLLSATTMMRTELERLQAQQQELKKQVAETPKDVTVLQAELKSCDLDLQHVHEHLAAVQRQEGPPSSDCSSEELTYLRTRVTALMKENRSWRRLLAAAQLDAANPSGLQLIQLADGRQETAQQRPASSRTAEAGVQASPEDSGSASPTGAPPGATEEVAALHEELAAAEAQVAALEAEKEQLMELSSLLRCEKDALLLHLPDSSCSHPEPAASPLALLGPLSPPTPLPAYFIPPLSLSSRFYAPRAPAPGWYGRGQSSTSSAGPTAVYGAPMQQQSLPLPAAGQHHTHAEAAAGPAGDPGSREPGNERSSTPPRQTPLSEQAAPCSPALRPKSAPSRSLPATDAGEGRRPASAASSPMPGVALLVSGSLTSRQPSPPPHASQRETLSQKASLRVLQKRRELQGRPKVRNYNIKD